MKNLTDQEVIESVLKGNSSDYSILVDRYKNKAYSMLKRMLKDKFDAEEVLQDCFLKAYNSLSSFKGDAKFSTWFYRIAYNTTLTKLSSKKRKIESAMSSVDDHFDLESEYYSDNFEKEDLSSILNEMINKLPEKHSAVLSLFYMQEMTCEEISEALNISLSNVKVLLYRSRNALRDLILKKNMAEELL